MAPNLSTKVASELGREIVAGRYRPGVLLEEEGALAARFGVSRTVIRDAAKILVGKGLIEVRRGIGTRVRQRTSWGLLDDDVLAWHQSIAPDAERLLQLMEIRRALEPPAALWAAERGSPASHEEIIDTLAEMKAACASCERFVIADARFHRAILRAGRNEYLCALEGMIFSALLGSIKLTNANPDKNLSSYELHRELAEAIVARDGKRAETAMRVHLADAAARLARAGVVASGAPGPAPEAAGKDGMTRNPAARRPDDA